jgi:predicted aspartyl protease
MQCISRVAFRFNRIFRCAGAGICRSGPIQCLLVIAVLLCAVPAAFADAPGPAVVPFHFVRGFAVIVPVMVNGRGPYDFMLDTGCTITTVDRELGQELALTPQEQGTVTTLTQRTPGLLAFARNVVVGPVTEQHVEIMIRDLSGLRRIAPTTRGVLGQNALNHADFLLDYRHKLMEFDTDGALAHSLGGHHVALRREMIDGDPQYANLAVHARVSDHGARAVDFLLDSGAASLVLFDRFENEGVEFSKGWVTDTAGGQRFADLREIQVVIDGKSREVATHVLAFKGAGKDIDGLLPTSIFDRIYISNREGFAMFEPKVKKPGPLDRMIAGLASQASAHGPKS